MNMIEKVARGIAASFKSADWEYYVVAAKAAIEAMREPTEEMINAGIRFGVDEGFGTGYREYKELYQKMIDAALKE